MLSGVADKDMQWFTENPDYPLPAQTYTKAHNQKQRRKKL